MKEQSIIIGDSEIVILAQFFIHKDYSITGKDLILDVLGKHYRDQQIIIKLLDGENIKFSGFDQFIELVCDQLHIPYNKIVIQTHNPDLHPVFNTDPLKLGIFISVNQYLPTQFDQDRSQARFVGCLLGRYNLNRFRLAYELDSAFPDDTFITFQPNAGFVKEKLKHVDNFYQQELHWLETKKFDKDLVSKHFMGMIDWYDACRNYGNVWNRYQIEVVSETDAIDNFWFTEKTANCLATGKPFVLVSGTGSLQRIRDMGFCTFDSIIDESYDFATHPYERVQKIIQSLNKLYINENKDVLITEMYRLAQQNIEKYNQYIQ